MQPDDESNKPVSKSVGLLNLYGISIKDERGAPDRRGFPDRTGPCNQKKKQKKMGHRAIFCLIRGTVQSGIQERGWVGNRVVFLLAWVFLRSYFSFSGILAVFAQL